MGTLTNIFITKLLSFIAIFCITSLATAQNKGQGRKSNPAEGAPQAKNQRWVKKGADILYAFPTDTKVGIGLASPEKAFEVEGDARFRGDVGLDTDLLLQGDLRLPNSIWTSDGMIGIGTTNPQHYLDVIGTSRFDGDVQFLQAARHEGIAEFRGVASFHSVVNLPGSSIWNYQGQVGIGTTTPGYMLEVAGRSYFQKQTLFGSSAEFSGAVTAKDQLDVEGNTHLVGALTVDSSVVASATSTFEGASTFKSKVNFPNGAWTDEGQLGIGTRTPGSMLDVAGAVNVQGDAEFNKSSAFAGNVQVEKNLDIDGRSRFLGNAQFDSSMTVTGASTFSGSGTFNTDLTVAGQSRFQDAVRFTNGVWTADGRLVIGGKIAAEDYRLQVKGSMDAEKLSLGGVPIKDAVALWDEQQTGDLVFTDGNVGIGTAVLDSTYKLSVNGRVRSKEVVVEAEWADFVFDEDYQLPTLDEVDRFIEEQGHLPDIPSAEQVEAHGVKVGEMQAKLLQKIEELTLYMIEMKKENEKLQREIKQLKAKISSN